MHRMRPAQPIRPCSAALQGAAFPAAAMKLVYKGKVGGRVGVVQMWACG